MALSQERKFTLTWKIENFSMSPQTIDEELESPLFMVKILEDSEWQLELKPNGHEIENVISCHLRCKNVGNNAGAIPIGFTISVFSADLTKVVPEEVNYHAFEKSDLRGFNSLISRSTIFGDKDAYLPNDTLTIKCSIWQNGGTHCKNSSIIHLKHCKISSIIHLKNEELTNSTKFNIQDTGLWDECTVITCIHVQRKNIFWPIKSFSSIDSNERLVIRTPSVLRNIPSLFITLNKSIDRRFAEIRIGKELDSSENTFVKCNVTVLHTPNNIDISAENGHYFESYSEDIWKFPWVIQFNILEEHKYFYRTCDVLYLQFEFYFSQPEDYHHMENAFLSPRTIGNTPHLIREFGKLYENEKLSDVTIQAGERVFKVHKIILTARSPVFAAMFDSDMKERNTGVVPITDVDPYIVDRMLVFMYTNVVGDVLAEDALKLYSVADMYDVSSLKVQCAWILASSLSVANVCEILILADQFNDSYLHDCVRSFIQENSVEILKSREWGNLIENNGTVAAKVMLKMLM